MRWEHQDFLAWKANRVNLVHPDHLDRLVRVYKWHQLPSVAKQ